MRSKEAFEIYELSVVSWFHSNRQESSPSMVCKAVHAREKVLTDERQTMLLYLTYLNGIVVYGVKISRNYPDRIKPHHIKYFH